MRYKYLFILCACGLVTACSTSRYQIRNDHAPDNIPTLENIADAVPIAQPYSRYANKDYKVKGQRYQVWRDIDELSQTGKASWYGKKFHGHKTANGEVYDMFSMSAAHKNLPLPSFLKVTNLTNDKSVIVRVNDRGPFHPDRIVDLSYAAAYKLDMLQSGTADVEIELIIPKAENETALTPKIQWYIQILASRNVIKTKQIADDISKQYNVTHRLVPSKKLYRLQLGPISDISRAQQLLLTLQSQYKNAYVFEDMALNSKLNR